jgi:hypothetical protein
MLIQQLQTNLADKTINTCHNIPDVQDCQKKSTGRATGVPEKIFHVKIEIWNLFEKRTIPILCNYTICK